MVENTFEGSPKVGGDNRKLLLIIGTVLGLGILAAVVFGVVLGYSMGWIGGGSSEIIVGFPDSDLNYDLYLVKLGEPEDDGIRIAKNVVIGDFAIYVFEENEVSEMIWGAGFMPDSSYVFLSYLDDDETVYEQMTTKAEETDKLFDSDDFPVLLAFPEQNKVVILEYREDDVRCYQAPFGEEADRVAKGTDCIFLPDGEKMVVIDVDDGETAFTLIDLDKGDENEFLTVEGVLDRYQVSADGSLMAYVETSDGEQELHLVEIQEGEEDKIADGVGIPDFGFASIGSNFYYVIEDEEGSLALYVNNESSPIAEGMILAAQFGPYAEYLLYSVGDEMDELVVSSYSIKNEESEEIIEGEGLQFAVLNHPEQVIIVETVGDSEITIHSSSLDGSELVEVLEEEDVYAYDVWNVPGHGFVYFLLYSAEGALGYAYPFKGEGFYFVEEWEDVGLLNVSPDGKLLAFSGVEDAGDDQVLYFVELVEGSDPEELDEDALWFRNAVFTKNSRELLYTVETGIDTDEISVNLVNLSEGPPDTLYDEAELFDVAWAELAPFDYLNFAYLLAGESYCPGAVGLNPGHPVESTIEEDGVVCFRFSAGSGEIWNVDIDSAEEGLDLEVTLLDRDGNYLAYNDDGLFDYNPWLAYVFESGGVYYLEVGGLDGGAGDFTIEIIEGEDSLANAESISLNETVIGRITENSLIYIESPEFEDEPLSGIFGQVYAIDLEENIPVNFLLTGDSSVEYGMVMFGEDGIYIEEGDSYEDYGEAMISVAPFFTGRYYLMVVALTEDAEPDTLKLEFELTSELVGEPVVESQEIFFDLVADGYLVRRAEDQWLFSGEAGMTVLITMESSSFDSYLELNDPDGYQLDVDDDSGGDRHAQLEYRLPAEGYYTIIARSYGNTGEGTYTLLLEEVEVTDQPTEPTGDGGGEIEIGESVTSTLVEGARDRWTFFANAGNTVSIELNSEEFDSVLELLNSDGIQLAYDDDSAGNSDAAIEDFAFEDSGTYTIVARDYGSSGGGEYLLTLYGENQVTGVEDNLDIGDTVTGSLAAGVEDRWTFDGTEDDRLIIVFSSDYFDTYLELFDEDGNLIAADDDGGEDQNSMLWNIVLPETGEYSIAARSFIGSAQGAYSLSVESSTLDLSGTLIYGGSDTGELDEGEWRVWSFDASAGDIVSIALDSDDFDAFLELRGNNGLILDEDDDGGETGSNSLISEYLITETGTYLIVVRAYSDTETGEFSLTLIEE